ncbi:MAG: hydrogenase maturation protease [Bacillota bacterium]|uniref:hydrogenase maturation protease n=1 Tax=Thermanaerosceptrum fracticalcis TaxID=1712410 RepID=UPI000551E9A1|nr:hydrogenase maturation protease [Thermanaerosceptrum fracticalcis]
MVKGNTIIIGLGNPILSDDGVGWVIAQELAKTLKDEFQVTTASLAGFNLLDLLAGYERTFIVDAIQTKNGKAGDIYRLTPEDLQFSRRLASVHDINLVTALELGKTLGLSLPKEIVIYAIEAQDTLTFAEKLSPPVEEAVPRVVKAILEELKQ